MTTLVTVHLILIFLFTMVYSMTKDFLLGACLIISLCSFIFMFGVCLCLKYDNK
jgi:hypothetical protein